jgi:hypothetical protein
MKNELEEVVMAKSSEQGKKGNFLKLQSGKN